MAVSKIRVIEETLSAALFQVRRRFVRGAVAVKIEHTEADMSPTGKEQWHVTGYHEGSTDGPKAA